MMCIQTPGSFVWALSLAAREGTKWSSWLVYVVTGTLQGILLAMCITWDMRARKGKTDTNGVSYEEDADGEYEDDEEDERTALVNNERR